MSISVREVQSKGAPAPVGPYSQAVRVGDLLVPGKAEGKLWVPDLVTR